MVGYFEDGPNLVTMAMNGWADGEPAWWLNLQAHPEASVDLADGRRTVRGAAAGEERSRLWARWREIDTNLDGYAARRSAETAVVILSLRATPVDDVSASRPRPHPKWTLAATEYGACGLLDWTAPRATSRRMSSERLDTGHRECSSWTDNRSRRFRSVGLAGCALPLTIVARAGRCEVR